MLVNIYILQHFIIGNIYNLWILFDEMLYRVRGWGGYNSTPSMKMGVYIYPTFRTKYMLFFYQATRFGNLTRYEAIMLWNAYNKSHVHMKLWDFIMQLPRREEIVDHVRYYFKETGPNYKFKLERNNNIL